MNNQIIRVSPEEADRIIIEWENSNGIANRNLYLTIEGKWVVAIDNTDGNCWVEQFETIEAAEQWLIGEGASNEED